MENLPETIVLLPDKPSWEVIVTTSQNKRRKDQMSVHVGIFNSLWSDAGKMGQHQGDPMNMITMEVTKQTDFHGDISCNIANWLWDILSSGTLRQMRFSTGKYLNDQMDPKYDNCVDVDVSLVLETGRIEHLIMLIDQMIGFNRKVTKFKEIHYDGSDARESLPTDNAVRQIQG